MCYGSFSNLSASLGWCFICIVLVQIGAEIFIYIVEWVSFEWWALTSCLKLLKILGMLHFSAHETHHIEVWVRLKFSCPYQVFWQISFQNVSSHCNFDTLLINLIVKFVIVFAGMGRFWKFTNMVRHCLSFFFLILSHNFILRLYTYGLVCRWQIAIEWLRMLQLQ